MKNDYIWAQAIDIMSLSKNKNTLKKLETLFQELNYQIRYERGNFKSGYCIVNDSRMIIVNKFFDTKARFDVLIDILSNVDYSSTELSEPSQEILQKVLKLDIFTKSLVA